MGPIGPSGPRSPSAAGAPPNTPTAMSPAPCPFTVQCNIVTLSCQPVNLPESAFAILSLCRIQMMALQCLNEGADPCVRRTRRRPRLGQTGNKDCFPVALRDETLSPAQIMLAER